MDFSDSPFFSVLRANLHHVGQRQKLIAENIANASTPGYTPHDTDEAAFTKALTAASRAGAGKGLQMAATASGHVGFADITSVQRLASKVKETPDSETTIDGNSVVLEEQMLKQNDIRNNYETSLALYQKGLQLIRMAIKAPGR